MLLNKINFQTNFPCRARVSISVRINPHNGEMVRVRNRFLSTLTSYYGKSVTLNASSREN